MLIFYLLCYAPVLKILTYYAQYYAHVKDLCLNFDCFIRVYSLCFIRVYLVKLTHYNCTNNNHSVKPIQKDLPSLVKFDTDTGVSSYSQNMHSYVCG